MDSSVLISSFAEFAKTKNIDQPTMIRILEDVFRTMIKKTYFTDENFDVIVNIDKGDLEIWRNRRVVADGDPELLQGLDVPISEARKIDKDAAVGDEVTDEIKLEDFGRRVVQTARQTLIQKVKDLEKDQLFDKYKDMVGDVVNCEVYQAVNSGLILKDNAGNELFLPREELIKKDRFRKGDMVKAIIHRVEKINGTPKIILSRTSPEFLERLFEQEVPEIYDGVISIRKVVREPGERAKVAVESFDDRIDPVGACVGMKGSRIHSIVRELQNENIDVINYTDNIDLLIQRALNPAKIGDIKIDERRGRVAVTMDRDQVSLAIGKGGYNIKLAGKLIGMEIDVYREREEMEEMEEDVELSEFTDDIEGWMLDELRKIGLDTAKSVLAVDRDDLVRRTDLEEEMVDYILDVLRNEFEEENGEEEAPAAE